MPRNTTDKCSGHNPKIGPLTDLHTRWHSSYFSSKERSSYKNERDLKAETIFSWQLNIHFPIQCKVLFAQISNFKSCDSITSMRKTIPREKSIKAYLNIKFDLSFRLQSLAACREKDRELANLINLFCLWLWECIIKNAQCLTTEAKFE